MATRCICSQTEWVAPEQHSRHCPESPERREIEQLRAALVGSEQQSRIILEAKNKWADRAREAFIRIEELETIISKMHTIITEYVAS